MTLESILNMSLYRIFVCVLLLVYPISTITVIITLWVRCRIEKKHLASNNQCSSFSSTVSRSSYLNIIHNSMKINYADRAHFEIKERHRRHLIWVTTVARPVAGP